MSVEVMVPFCISLPSIVPSWILSQEIFVIEAPFQLILAAVNIPLEPSNIN